jgi:predicted metal-dependent peptidase
MRVPGSAFYIELVMRLKTYFTRDIPTACVNARMQMLINPDFFKDGCKSVGERAGLLAHEASHIAYDHLDRGEFLKDPKRYNNAGDYLINNDLTKAGIPLPKGGLVDSKFIGMTSEQVYNILPPSQPGTSPGIGCDLGGLSMDDYGVPDPNAPVDMSQLKSATRDLLNSAATAAKLAGGFMPGAVQIALDHLNNPVIPFETMLKRYTNALVKSERSFKQPNWKFAPEFYLPSTVAGEKITSAVFAIDTSGSTSGEVFLQSVTDVANVFKSMNMEYIDVILFDTVIQDEIRVKSMKEFMTKVTFKGGGGTDVNPALKRIEELKPNVCIIVSDGWFNSKPVKIKVPTIWAIFNNTNFNVDYGKVYPYDIRNQNTK